MVPSVRFARAPVPLLVLRPARYASARSESDTLATGAARPLSICAAEQVEVEEELEIHRSVWLPCVLKELESAEAQLGVGLRWAIDLCSEDAVAALELAQRAEAELEGERRASERTLVSEAHGHALMQAESWQREANLRATLESVQQEAAEAKTAAAAATSEQAFPILSRSKTDGGICCDAAICAQVTPFAHTRTLLSPRRLAHLCLCRRV